VPTGIVISRPIIPTSRKEPFDDPDWLFECKYDGFRALYHLERGRCRIVSRRGNVLDRFAAFGEQLATELAVDEAILDGELIAADATGRPQFYELLRRARAPSYVAFDLLWLDGADLRPLPLSERRQRLLSILPNGSAVIVEALSVQGRGHELFELMRDH
jgi:bifunctional non-homologous end joining protein LigD